MSTSVKVIANHSAAKKALAPATVKTTSAGGVPTVNHLTSVGDLHRLQVDAMIRLADELRALPRLGALQRQTGRIVGTLFYEPSTRTRLSFEAAALRLGAHVIGAENALDNSSAKKGERLEDTLRVVGAYTDAIVIRHHEDHTLTEAVKLARVPVISAGTGSGEHPTQALLDVYTLYREFGAVDGLRIAILGDLRYGRTVHSLVQLLGLFENIHLTLVPIPGLELPDTIMRSLQNHHVQIEVSECLEEVLPKTDAVYQTRVQLERIPKAHRDLATTTHIGPRQLSMLPEHARILHPLPRVDEIDPVIDTDPRAAYFRQVENGLYMRMAILDNLLTGGIS